ncbi:prepilin peptidase [Nocardioides sp. Kera G14]|uniref:prepilin peptidase n=1 Tax=Nocardioides sp. Kera G14 TaxID=2884264 RepID=UPI001D118F91|nr:A24 family peptidase [Nocardioides sp. Kera G14]UDY23071.1 prepilin peptidase [Nocardioides sp. Kera G14]
MEPVIVVAAALLGLAIGSFLNVVIARVPRRESLLTPSHCPACTAPIRGRHNVPVVSWLVLRGRCHDCDARISVRYPLVEALTAVTFVGIAVWMPRIGTLDGGGRWLLAAALALFAATSIALAFIDAETHRLPDAVVGPAYVLCGTLLAVTSAMTGDWPALVRGAAGLVLLGGGYYAVHMVRPDGMGFGDVKLAGLVGLVTGYVSWAALAVGAFAAFLLAGCYAVVLLAAHRAHRRSGVAFGPWMLAGGWVGLVMGTPVATGYLRVSGLA